MQIIVWKGRRPWLFVMAGPIRPDAVGGPRDRWLAYLFAQENNADRIHWRWGRATRTGLSGSWYESPIGKPASA